VERLTRWSRVRRELTHQAGPALELDSWCGSSRLWPGRMATSSASKLDDASCARCDDDHAAERCGDEQGDAERQLAMEDQERDRHVLKVLHDEDEDEDRRSHKEDYRGPYGTRARSQPLALGGVSRRTVACRLRGRLRLGAMHFAVRL
jgi:hypothetical protein